MNETDRLKYLKLALRVFAAVFVLGVYPLTVLWPSGWSWHPGPSEYLQMIIAIYATMAVQSIANTQHFGHLYGDVPALFVVAAVLGWLSPRALTLKFGESAI